MNIRIGGFRFMFDNKKTANLRKKSQNQLNRDLNRQREFKYKLEQESANKQVNETKLEAKTKSVGVQTSNDYFENEGIQTDDEKELKKETKPNTKNEETQTCEVAQSDEPKIEVVEINDRGECNQSRMRLF